MGHRSSKELLDQRREPQGLFNWAVQQVVIGCLVMLVAVILCAAGLFYQQLSMIGGTLVWAAGLMAGATGTAILIGARMCWSSDEAIAGEDAVDAAATVVFLRGIRWVICIAAAILIGVTVAHLHKAGWYAGACIGISAGVMVGLITVMIAYMKEAIG